MDSILHIYEHWLRNLVPPYTFYAATAFIPCVVVLTALFIRHRITLHRRGEQLMKHKTKPHEYAVAAVMFAALFYARHHFPSVAQLLDWPDRTFPMYRQHGVALWLGFGAAGYAAQGLSGLFAALFLRSTSRGNAGGRGGAPGFPPGWDGWTYDRTVNRSEWEGYS